MNLTPAQITQLLQAVGAMNGTQQAMFGWSLTEDGLQTSVEPIATYTVMPTVSVPASRGLVISESYSYSNSASNLQRRFSSSGSLSVGIPDIFDTDSSYSVSSVAETIADTTTVHFNLSIVVQMQEIKFPSNALTLNPRFVQAVTDCLNAAESDNVAGTRQLLDTMAATWGQFVTNRILAGGRISLSSSKQVSDLTQIDKLTHDFKTAAKASLVLEGVPIDFGSQYDIKWANSQEVQQITAQWSLTTEVVGGDLSLFSASGKPSADHVTLNKTAYQAWIASLNTDPSTWRVIAFGSRALKPVIDLLNDNDTTFVKTLLRNYFRRMLVQQDTKSAGYRHDYDFGPPAIGNIAGPQQMQVYYGNDVCQVRITYGDYDGGATELPPSNEMRRNNGDCPPSPALITFQPGDQFKALDIWKNPGNPSGWNNNDLVQRVCFIMASGARYPGDDSYFGRNPGANVRVYLEAPRVRAVVGSFGAVVHELRLRYLMLSDQAATRDYLLAVEPYLFPTGDYGPISHCS